MLPAHYSRTAATPRLRMEAIMKSLRTLILVPALMVAAACGRDEPAVDAALDSDLRLAGQAAPGLDSISMMERQDAQSQLVTTAPRRTSAAPARRTTSSARRTSTARSSGSGVSSAGTGTARAPRTVTVRNTKRDAAIGATAGAILGASTSRNKVKGGLIGAAIGGLAGAVIGHNIDVQKRPVP
jgi:hypothetical protein